MKPLLPAYAGLEPAAVWQHFSALNQIPRPSGQEAAAVEYVSKVGAAHGATVLHDARGNCVLRVPGVSSAPGAPVVCLQSHLDMVCQKRPGVEMDFEVDPIVPRRVEGAIYATGTTLGADNGLGAALALAALTAEGVKRPPLELLFTVEEETGLFGAQFLDPAMVTSRLLINLDSEDPEEITVGCAGGAGTTLHLELSQQVVPEGFLAREIHVSGLKGGHSGIQINEKLGNALKFLSDILRALATRCPGVRLASLQGGTAHNAIPRDAHAVVVYPAEGAGSFEEAFEYAVSQLCTCWHEAEGDLIMSQATIKVPATSCSEADSATILTMLDRLPHGVYRMSGQFPGKVETSSNLAEAHLTQDKFEVHVSNRSFLAGELAQAQARVAQVGTEAGARIEVRDGYPGWEPSKNSRLLQLTEAAFAHVNGKPAQVEVVHAGLECGILSEKLPGMEAVSFGPLIKGAHTPEEWADIQSVEVIWHILRELLARLAQENNA